MEQIVLEAKERSEKGKTVIKHSRREGWIPAVVYGRKSDTQLLFIPVAALDKALHRGAAHKIINLEIAGKNGKDEKPCVIHEIQRDVFGKRVLHIDFHQISMEEKITAKIPLTLKGEAPGIKEGGVLDHVLWEVEVKALPLTLPEKLTADISGLLINQSIHVRDIPLPEGVEILEDSSEVVAVIHPPRVEEVVAAPVVEAAVAVAPAQPEVISKGKKEEEGVPEKAPEKAKEEKPKK